MDNAWKWNAAGKYHKMNNINKKMRQKKNIIQYINEEAVW